jgi:hypothetical protein
MPLSLDAVGVLAALGAVYAVRSVAHDVGDHWVQTHHQALTKGKAGRVGAWACIKHVATYEATALAFFAFAALFVDFGVDPLAFTAGTLVSGVSHYVADRREPLRRIADACISGELYRLEAGLSGAYQLDQSWHRAWTFAAAVVTVGGTEHLPLSLGLCLLTGMAIAYRVRRWERARHHGSFATSRTNGDNGSGNAVGMAGDAAVRLTPPAPA